ncbi:MAG TPA: XdhC family protein [Tepidisphaeraceae bacterium]|jgi:xanthine/CO dehydrogenase XdhC/CoxF family maturation factor
MRDRLQIVQAFESLCSDGKPTALATVVAVEGSSYRRPGARMLIAGDGRTWGTVSGGCLERDVARRARMLIAAPGNPLLISYETDEEDPGEENARPIVDPGPSLGCGGRIEILIQRISAADPAALAALSATVRQRRPAALATILRVGCAPDDAVKCGSQLLRIAHEPISGRISDPSLDVILRDQLASQSPAGRAFTHCRHTLPRGGWADVLVEWLHPAQSLAIFGDGHDVAPLVDLANSLGWHVRVIGARPEATLRQRFPLADEIICCPDDPAIEAANLAEDVAAIIMGHNFNRDAAALGSLLKNPRAYIGVLGPRQRTARLLAAAGMAGDEQQLFSPIGLDIGAETPEEIALSILAEIRAVAAGRAGGPLRERAGPIHLHGEGAKFDFSHG